MLTLAPDRGRTNNLIYGLTRSGHMAVFLYSKWYFCRY